MFDFKVAFLNHVFKFEVISDLPGRLRLKVRNFKKIPSEAFEYQLYAVEAIQKLKGVNSVKFNFTIGTILIQYDKDRLNSKVIVDWLNSIKKLAVENISIITSMEDKSEEEVKEILFNILDSYIKRREDF